MSELARCLDKMSIAAVGIDDKPTDAQIAGRMVVRAWLKELEKALAADVAALRERSRSDAPYCEDDYNAAADYLESTE